MISAIVLAAGQSIRMGQQKMLLPWGETIVIGKVVSTLLEAGVEDIRVVVGGSQSGLLDVLHEYKIDAIFNKDYRNGEMLTSIQVGLRWMGINTDAVLVVLGDQPQIEILVVQVIVNRYMNTHPKIIVPSYKMHRGHPWLVERSYWDQILELRPPQTMRDFLNNHNEAIDYINVNTPSVIQDLDTQNDYSQFKP